METGAVMPADIVSGVRVACRELLSLWRGLDKETIKAHHDVWNFFWNAVGEPGIWMEEVFLEEALRMKLSVRRVNREAV